MICREPARRAGWVEPESAPQQPGAGARGGSPRWRRLPEPARARRFLALAALVGIAAAPAAAAPLRARLEGGPFLPYRINPAVLAGEEGLLGDLEIDGRRWDGAAVPLFRARLRARTERAPVAFYLDEDLRSLEIRLTGPAGARALQLDLAALEGLETAAEAELRTRMRALDPPVRFPPTARPPARFALEGSALGSAGGRASAELFGVPISRVPLLFLGLSSLAAALAAAIRRPGGRRGKPALLLAVTAALGASLGVAWLAPPRPVLFRAVFAGGDPSAPVSGVLERRVEERPSHTLVSYAASQIESGALAQRGQVELVGLSALPEQGIPLEEVAGLGSAVRFSPAPVVTLSDGQLRLGGRRFVVGWVVRHGSH